MRFILGSFAMLFFSKRLVDEGMNVIRTNSYDVSGYRDVNQNWKLLKGLELANCFQQCIDLADSMCEKANGKAPILHGMCIDSIIGSYCRLKQFDKVEEYRALATKNNIRIEGSTYDKMIRVQITSDAWKTIYEDMKEKARELSIALSEEE